MSEIDDSVREFLNECHYATLATLNEDGSIHQTPVWYLFEDDRFYISSATGAKKFKNIQSRPKISVMVDSRRQQGYERWVGAQGTAEIITGQESEDMHLKIIKRYLTDAALDDEVVGTVFNVVAEATIILKPDSIQSWELKSLDDQFFGGKLRQNPEKWFITVD